MVYDPPVDVDPSFDPQWNAICEGVLYNQDILAHDVLRDAYEGYGVESEPGAPDFVGYRSIVLDRFIFENGLLYGISSVDNWELVDWTQDSE